MVRTTSFDPGDVWNYTCTVVAPAGPAQVDNTAKVCGTYNSPAVQPVTVCDEDTHTFTVPPPYADAAGDHPPATTPPARPRRSGGAAGHGRLRPRAAARPEWLREARRSARRCSGRSIAAVAFYVDGKLVKSFTGARASTRPDLKPARYGFGRHQLVAHVTFAAGSGTQARRLPADVPPLRAGRGRPALHRLSGARAHPSRTGGPERSGPRALPEPHLARKPHGRRCRKDLTLARVARQPLRR